MGITDLEQQFTFYASYHHSTVNKIIHVLCVWPILWSALVLAEYIPLEVPETLGYVSFIHPIHPLNVTFFAAAFYAVVYILMDKWAGIVATLLLIICLITARIFYLGTEIVYGTPAWKYAIGVQVICWVAQFIGHGTFEGRAPALFDNLMQSVVMAPMFVLLEILFSLGYRPEFQNRVWKNVAKEIAKFKSQANRKKVVNMVKKK